MPAVQKELTYKHIWKVAYPLILGGMMQTIINVMDVAFLGRVSETALAASAMAGLFFVVLFVPGMGFSIGTQILIARLTGEKKQASVGKVFNHTIYFILLLALILFLITKFWGLELLNPFVESEEILIESEKYLSYRSYGFFFGFIATCFRAFYAGIADTKVISFATVLMAVANYFLNDILIFGKYGFPAMGIEGAAIASVLTEIIAVLFYLGYTTLFHKKYQVYNLIPLSKIDWQEYKKVMKISTPIMLQYFVSLVVWFLFFSIIEHMGKTELAISNVVRSIYMILMIPLFGFGSATNTLVSNLIGQGKQELVMKLIWRTVLLCVLSSVVFIIINLAFPEFGLALFTNKAHLIEGAKPILYIISGAIMFFSIAIIMISGVSGTGNTLMTLILECVTLSIYLGVTYYMAIEVEAPLTGVWACEYVYFISMAIGAYLYLRFGNWRNFKIK